MVYQWKYGITGISAQKTGEYFKTIEKRDGEVIPKTVVNEARPESALLHPAFEWNDTEAAEKYREQQAKQIIRNVVVVQERKDNTPVVVRAIVNVSSNTYKPQCGTSQQGRYVSVERAMQEPQMKEALFQNALAELSTFKAKYKGISQFAKLFEEIDRLTKPA